MTTNLIRTENYEINGVPFVRTYSDAGRYVVREGVSYEEACDPAEFGRTYFESEPIQTEEYEEAQTNKLLTDMLEDNVMQFVQEEEPDYFDEWSEEPDYFA